MFSRALGLVILLTAGCSSEPAGRCGCTLDVPEGHLDIDCGMSRCLGGAGYLCVGPSMVSSFPAACTIAAVDLGACTPACAGRVCGTDSCGGPCGTCAVGRSCSGGQCVAGCTPSCVRPVCGTDGCGG